MSSIKTTSFEGDVAIGRNITAGGNADINGHAVVHKNLTVDGWLEARNIRGYCKGMFLTPDSLLEKYSEPHEGWVALVGDEFPADLYVVEYNESDQRCEWVKTGKKVSLTSDMEAFNETVREIFETAQSLQSVQTKPLSYFDSLQHSEAAELTVRGPRFYRCTLSKSTSDIANDIGVTFLFGDASGCQLTQVLFTNCSLTEEGSFNGSHQHLQMKAFVRFFNVRIPDADSALEPDHWSAWVEFASEATQAVLQKCVSDLNNVKTDVDTLKSKVKNILKFDGLISEDYECEQVGYAGSEGKVCYSKQNNAFVLVVGTIGAKYYNAWPGSDAYGKFTTSGITPKADTIYIDAKNRVYTYEDSTLKEIELSSIQQINDDIRDLQDADKSLGFRITRERQVLRFKGFISDEYTCEQSSASADSGSIYYSKRNNAFVLVSGPLNPKYYSNWQGADAYGTDTLLGKTPFADKIYIDDKTNALYVFNGTNLVSDKELISELISSLETKLPEMNVMEFKGVISSNTAITNLEEGVYFNKTYNVFFYKRGVNTTLTQWSTSDNYGILVRHENGAELGVRPQYNRLFILRNETNESIWEWDGENLKLLIDIKNLVTKKELEDFKEETDSKIYDTKPYEFVDLHLPSGNLWATCNIGAESPTDAGLFFGWGETKGYTKEEIKAGDKTYNIPNYKFAGDGATSSNDPQFVKYCNNARFGKDGYFTDDILELETIDDAAHFNMGSSWKMPTKEDFQELLNNTSQTWVTDYNGSGVNGILFRSNNGQELFFPAVGLMQDNEEFEPTNLCLMWSSSLNEEGCYNGINFTAKDGTINITSTYRRYYGMPVRGITKSRDDNNNPKFVEKKDFEEINNEILRVAKSAANSKIVNDIKEKVVTLEKDIYSAEIAPGDIVLVDNEKGIKTVCKVDDLNRFKETHTPIGVVVIPPSHDIYGTGELAMISLKFMSISSPDAGSNTAASIYYGINNIDDPLTNFNTIEGLGPMDTNKVPSVIENKTYSQGHLPSNNTMVYGEATCPHDLGLKYQTIYANYDTTCYIPSPYLTGGARNPLYGGKTVSEFNAMSDFDGLMATKKLLTYANRSQSDWKTAPTITNNSGEYVPAAICSWRYHTEGTNQGDWYLPAMGELGYLSARWNEINTSLKTINNVYSGMSLAAALSASLYLSSTEVSSTAYKTLNYNGGVQSTAKSSGSVVRAFARIKVSINPYKFYTTEEVDDKFNNLEIPEIDAKIEGIVEKIPSQASAENQLADKDFVNSSIATNTAEFKGTHNSLEELQIIAADANDYGFVVSKDSNGNTVYNRYKYVEGQGWVFEYALNNSSFTAAQWAAIQSGITSGDVAKIKELDKELETLGFTVGTLNTGLGEANARIEDLESEKAKKAVFIDLWNKACGKYGKYNEQTRFFELNGLTDITYEQALEIYNAGPIEGTAGYARYRTSNIRTNLPGVGTGDVVTLTNTFYKCTKLEIAFVEVANTTINSFNDCSKLRVIGRPDGFASSLYNINASGADNTTFRNCASLEMVYGMIKSANPNIYVADCPKLTLENFQFWVKNASNTIAVTITVHPDVYAKLTDTGNTEWNALLSEAAEKQISFATI